MASSGLLFKYILRGDDEDTCEEMMILEKSTICTGFEAGFISTTSRGLKLVFISISGLKVQGLFDSGTIPNLLS